MSQNQHNESQKPVPSESNWQSEEAQRRDHRRIGKELELFHFDETAPGMPYWLPKGQRVLNELISFWREQHELRNYQEVSTPLINEKRLWEISGHWQHYKDNMFVIPVSDTVTYGVKPMNCPNAMVIFNHRVRSYRELPLRLSDCDPLHRHEPSGALCGLLRVQKFQQDDAHIFVSEDQIEAEYDRILEIASLFYGIFDMKYSFRLGTMPKEGYIGDLATWERAEASLRKILDKHAGHGNYEIADGDGAFYGPKVDILMEDCLGRQWQMGTLQLDFQLPRRFDCQYVDRDGKMKVPVVIHRVIYGSLERFMGILIEHTAGAFPVWLAPIQARIIPIADRHHEYANSLADRLRAQKIRVEVDDGDDRMNGKIRRAQLEKIPYMLVVGDREAEQESVSLRLRTKENLGSVKIEKAIERIKSAIADKKSL